MRAWMRLVTVMPAIMLVVNLNGVSFGSEPNNGESTYHATKCCGKEQAGFLVLPQDNSNGTCRLTVEPYFPQPGDLLIYDNCSKFLSFAFRMIGSDTPIHAAIVIERPDGTPAILEVGPNSRPHAFTKTFIVEVWPRLESYPGIVMVRRPRTPVTHEKSVELTHFAEAQVGKKFAVGRLALQGTPFRCRCGLRQSLFAKTCFDRDRWICSENAVAAATIAGILDPKVHFANAMYPRDLAYDERYDLSEQYFDPVMWSPVSNPRIEGNRLITPKKEEN